jgi:hypothetical protein
VQAWASGGRQEVAARLGQILQSHVTLLISTITKFLATNSLSQSDLSPVCAFFLQIDIEIWSVEGVASLRSHSSEDERSRWIQL